MLIYQVSDFSSLKFVVKNYLIKNHNNREKEVPLQSQKPSLCGEDSVPGVNWAYPSPGILMPT